MKKILVACMSTLLTISLFGSPAQAVNKPANKKMDLQKTLRFIEDWSKRDKYDKFPESPSFAYYNVSSLKLLKGEIGPDVRTKVIVYLKSCQLKDGGFSSNPQYDKTSNTIFTFYALRTLDVLDSLDAINKEKAADFVLSLVQRDGSIAAKAADTRTNLATTYYGVASLALLKATVGLNAGKTVDFINTYREPHKGYCMVKNAISTPVSTHMAVRSLVLLGGLSPVIRTEVIAYLKDSRYTGHVQDKQYSTLPTIEELSSVLETLADLSALNIVNREKVAKFVESLYISENGGFGPEPGLGTTPPSTYHALLCLNKLGAIKR